MHCLRRRLAGTYKKRGAERIDERERLVLRTKVKETRHIEIYGGLKEDVGMKNCQRGPEDDTSIFSSLEEGKVASSMFFVPRNSEKDSHSGKMSNI